MPLLLPMVPVAPRGPGASGLSVDSLGGSAARPAWAYGGRTVFRSSSLSDQPGSATTWAMDGAQIFSEATIARLAGVLGIDGAPRLLAEYGHMSLTVGSADWTGPAVFLGGDALGSFNYYDPAHDTQYCPPAGTPKEDDPTTTFAPGECAMRDLGPAIEGEAALATARDLLTSLGLDLTQFEVTEREHWDEGEWNVVEARRVDSAAAGSVRWSVYFTGTGVRGIDGQLAPLVALGDYDVVSPVEAVERLGDPRFASPDGPFVVDDGILHQPPDLPPGDGSTVPVLPGVADPGSAIGWPVAEVTIVEARLVTSTQNQADGSMLLVPTYELVDEDGAIWSVIALHEAHLDFDPIG